MDDAFKVMLRCMQVPIKTNILSKIHDDYFINTPER